MIAERMMCEVRVTEQAKQEVLHAFTYDVFLGDYCIATIAKYHHRSINCTILNDPPTHGGYC